jgi:hypothetical protein
MLIGAELAEASVESDRAATSDKRKRQRDNMNPPRANSNVLFSTDFALGEDAT